MDHRGHAAHFLTRVDRLNAQHAELALGLYRDHQLVKYLLRLVQVPENSQRVALALDDTRDAPHVIVTRDGAFVTCLGRGMRVNGAAVVSRRSLDEVSSRAEALRQLLVEAQAGGTKERDRHMRRLRKARGALTREEFENLLKWAPLLAGDYLQRAIHTASFVRQAMGRLKLARRIGTRHEPLLRAFCERSWEIQHLAMLLAADRRGLQVAISRADRNAGGSTRHHTWLIHELMATGNWVGLFRGALLAASMSDLVVPALISQVEPGAFNLDSQTRSLTALLAVLLRSPDLEATIVPVFERWSTRSDSLTEEFLASWANLLLAIWRNPTPDLFTRVSVEFADKLAETQLDTVQQCERMKNFARTSKRAMFAALPLRFSIVGETVAVQLTYLWEICNMSPADLYPPFKDRFRVGWTRREGMFWLEPQLKPSLQPKRRPFVKAAQPERNDPCPCDSGKKYKRCCGVN